MSKLSLKFLKKSFGVCSNKLQTLALVPLADAFTAPPSKINTGSEIIVAVKRAAGFLFDLFTALAVVFIILSALFYLTAAGNQTQLDRAKNILIYSIVAIVIALIAGGIVSFVGDVGGVPVS